MILKATRQLGIVEYHQMVWMFIILLIYDDCPLVIALVEESVSFLSPFLTVWMVDKAYN